MDILVAMLGGYVLLAAVAYMLPALISLLRGHRNAFAVAVLNVLLGWTFLGWVVALVWSLTGQRDDRA